MRTCAIAILGLILVCATMAHAEVLVGDQGTGLIWQYNNAGGAKTLFADVTLNGLSSPTHLDVVGNFLYVNTGGGVAYYNLTTKAYVGMATTSGGNAMAIDAVNKVLFTGSGYSIFKTDISGATPGSTVKIATTPDSLVALTMPPEKNGDVVAYVDVSGQDRFMEYTAAGTYVYDHTSGIPNYEGKQDFTYTAARVYWVQDTGNYSGSGLLCNYSTIGQNGGVIGLDATKALWGAVTTGPDGKAYFAENPQAGGHYIKYVSSEIMLTTTTLISDNSLSRAWGIAFYTPAPMPEPATMSLLAIGGIAALIRRRRK